MGKGLNQFKEQVEDIRDDGIHYAGLRWTSMRLSAVEKLSAALSKAYGFIIFLVLIFIALAFLMGALALWIGELTGRLSLGFLISGSGFLLGAGVVWLIRGKLAVNTLVRYFINVFFTGEEEEDGTENH